MPSDTEPGDSPPSLRASSSSWFASLCRYVKPDGTFGKVSREKMSSETTLTPAQVSRGMAELKEKLVIEPVPRLSIDGRWMPDRSNFGHVATYRFTKECWNFVSRDLM